MYRCGGGGGAVSGVRMGGEGALFGVCLLLDKVQVLEKAYARKSTFMYRRLSFV